MDKINFIKHYQNSIEKSQDNPERVLHCLKKLQNLRVNVQDLQETGIGKTVNLLRKLDGEAGELATKLVTNWKDQISKMSEEDSPKLEEPAPTPREKSSSQNHSKKSHHSSTKSSSSSENIDSNKKSKSHSSSSSNHHHSSSTKDHSSSTNHHSSSSSHKDASSSSNHHHSEHKEHKEKDKKSSDSKHHSSHKSHHASSSGSSHKSSNSHKRSREDVESKENETNAKKSKSDHEKVDKKPYKSSEPYKESTSSSTNGTSSKSSKKKDHKTSPTKRKHSNEDESQEFDGAQGIGFAEALASFDIPTGKQKKHDMADKMVSIKSSSSSSSVNKIKSSTTSSSSSSSSHKKEKEKEKEKEKIKDKSSSSRPSTSSAGDFKKPIQNLTQPPKLLTQKPKLDLLPDIVNELPNDLSIPEYRPLPMNSAMKEYILGSNSQSRHTKTLSEGELLVQSFSSKSNRMKVFSGNSKARSQIPKLFDMCLRILQDNIDYLECTGGVPFEILKPVLERAKPEQLQVIEYYNPYLLEDSDVLWKPHCQRKWKCKQPSEMETWRELYERSTREDEERLSRLTQNIQQKQVITSNGIQKTKIAFVDSMVKPPRGMMRKQEQFGTNRKLVASPAARVESLKNIQPNLAAPGDVRLRVAAGLRDDAQQVVGRNAQRVSLTKKAPMMAKILSKLKR